jgi:hypothetical protein
MVHPSHFRGAALLMALAISPAATAADASPAQQQLNAAAAEGQYAFLVWQRGDDAATQAMRSTVAAHVERSAGKAVLVPVTVNDPAEAQLVARFDATRTPLPCVMGLAPNGAVTGVYPLQVSAEQLQRAILTPKYSEMVKALQEQKLVVVCLQPRNGGTVPAGVAEFESFRRSAATRGGSPFRPTTKRRRRSSRE